MAARTVDAMTHNHLENNRYITTKPGLVRALRKYYYSCEGYSVYESIPTSFIITAHVQDLEYRQFVTRFREIKMKNSAKEPMNQGKGIEVFRDLAQVKQVLHSKSSHSLWLVQKYVERPLLFKGRKFDIRIWALMTAKHELFYYRKGYLRTSSSEYDTAAQDNYIHLTNNCLQRNGGNYGAHEKGNTLSFEEFQEYLGLEFPAVKVHFWDHLLPRMKDLMIDTFAASTRHLQKGRRNSVFEFVGFDFLIDEDFRVWLIEVNTNPYLGVPNEYIAQLIPVMIDDLLALTLDMHFPPALPRDRTENDFELLYCEYGSLFSHDGRPVNQRAPLTSVYPLPQFAQPPLAQYHAPPEKLPQKELHCKAPVKDPFQEVKGLIHTFLVLDTADFAGLLHKIMAHLKNWELVEEEQVLLCAEALKLMIKGGLGTSWDLQSCLDLYSLCSSQHAPTQMRLGLLQVAVAGCRLGEFAGNLIETGMAAWAVGQVLEAPEDSFRQACVSLIVELAAVKDIRKQPEAVTSIREKFIFEGGLACLYRISLEENDMKAQINSVISTHFSAANWKVLEKCIDLYLSATTDDEFPTNFHEQLQSTEFLNTLKQCASENILKKANDKKKALKVLNDFPKKKELVELEKAYRNYKPLITVPRKQEKPKKKTVELTRMEERLKQQHEFKEKVNIHYILRKKQLEKEKKYLAEQTQLNQTEQSKHHVLIKSNASDSLLAPLSDEDRNSINSLPSTLLKPEKTSKRVFTKNSKALSVNDRVLQGAYANLTIIVKKKKGLSVKQ